MRKTKERRCWRIVKWRTIRYLCNVPGTNVKFKFPLPTEEDDDGDGGDNDAGDDGSGVDLSKHTDEQLAEVASIVQDVVKDVDEEKSCFDFYG